VKLFYFIFGILFGYLLSRSGAADYNYIQGMFLFTEFQLYGILGCGVAVAAPGIWWLKRKGIPVKSKPSNRGNIYGGVLFGVGWAVTGMCPGPILVNLGEGKLYAIAAFAGVLVGAGSFGVLYPKLFKTFGLPPLS
jgi:uncharacterized membrane protein YedE/YeeE